MAKDALQRSLHNPEPGVGRAQPDEFHSVAVQRNPAPMSDAIHDVQRHHKTTRPERLPC